MRRILITGSNRGIGLELVRLYLQQADTLLFATCRQPAAATALTALANQQPDRVHILALDVTNQQSIEAAAGQINHLTDGLDMLVNNAGILPGGIAATEANAARFGALEVEAMAEVFRVNTISPMIITQAFIDLLRKGQHPRIINMSSDAGSIALRDSGINYSYAASKAALNMLTRGLASDLRADGVIVISIHPGWIQTDMGGPSATRTPDETLPTMVKVIDNLTMVDTSSFFNWDGTRVLW